MKKAGGAGATTKAARPSGARRAKRGAGTAKRSAAPTTKAAAPLSEEGLQGFASRLGPGLITGAADDDPSGIATYSQAGAQFRFALGWTLFLSTPLLIGIL